jgi:hypothetical protein
MSAKKKDTWGCHRIDHLCLIGLIDAKCEFGKGWQIEERGRATEGRIRNDARSRGARSELIPPSPHAMATCHHLMRRIFYPCMPYLEMCYYLWQKVCVDHGCMHVTTSFETSCLDPAMTSTVADLWLSLLSRDYS